MTKACMLIKTVPNATDKVLDQIRKMNGIKKAYISYGRWDLVAFVEAPIGEISKIAGTINSMDGVRSTETLPQA